MHNFLDLYKKIICKNNFKNKLKNLKFNKDKINKVNFFINEIFGIEKVMFVSDNSKNEFFLRKIFDASCFTTEPFENEKYLYVFLSNFNYINGHSLSFENYLLLINLEDFNINTPRIFNTIENTYKNIAVFGKGKLAEFAFNYFSLNKNINVEKVDIVNEKLNTNTHYDLIFNSNLSVLPENIFLNTENNYSVATYNYFEFITKQQYSHFDIENNIVPYLTENGVKVIYVNTRNRNIIKSLPFFSKISTFFSFKKFSKISEGIGKEKAIIKYFGETELLDDLNNSRTLNTSRGYAYNISSSKFINYENGFRKTIGNTDQFIKTIHFFGPCIVSGSYCKDQDTIPSLLKTMLPNNIRILNHGNFSYFGINLNIRNTVFNKGDLVFIFYDEADGKQNAPVISLNSAYTNISSPHKHFADSVLHCDKIINKSISVLLSNFIKTNSLLFPSINEEIFFGSEIKKPAPPQLLNDVDYLSWLNKIASLKPNNGINGAIVMNCNPFTLGHQYLIKTAAEKVDNLFVFVVEEDKSFFKFKDRLELVKKGTLGIKNVIILPSGKFVLSSDTLPGYFQKSELGNQYMDASADLELFATTANFLNISVRFAGAEPFDKFTCQYNRSMEKELKKYGINFVEIPRISNSNNIISATFVRKLLKENNFDEIAKYVPPTTLEFLKNNYKK